jgi:hypothetical protein
VFWVQLIISGGWESNNTILSKIEILNSNVIFYINQNEHKNFKYEHGINNWRKYIPKQPLFKTEDGIDIYEGDSFYCVDIGLVNNFKPFPRYGGDGLDYKSIEVKSRCFKEYKAAENYIKCNKPCLSLTEVLNNIDGLNILNRDNIKNNITKLVKSKLNL